MRVDAFDFDLPGELIALRPAVPRDTSRLLVVDPAKQDAVSDCMFGDLPKLLNAGDTLVFNDTRVIPARLHGRRTGRGETEPRIEATLHRRVDAHRWWAFAKPGRKLQIGDTIIFGRDVNACFEGSLCATVSQKADGGQILLSFEQSGTFLDASIARHGEMPLPPYIASKRDTDARDDVDYQTVFARRDGAVAAPTAGLHFTQDVLERLQDSGVHSVTVTLHVGAGTFLPVKSDTTEQHQMHEEWGELGADVADALKQTKAKGGRIVCVGTTSLRLLEAAAVEGEIAPFSGTTDIFITPGYEFRAADMLLTNFHLPRSTLFMLVSAFSGLETMQSAYAHAISSNYRFYSYGDACLLTCSAH